MKKEKNQKIITTDQLFTQLEWKESIFTLTMPGFNKLDPCKEKCLSSAMAPKTWQDK